MAGRTDFRGAAVGVLALFLRCALAGALGCGGAAATGDGGIGGHAGGDGGLPGDASPVQGVLVVPIESRQTIADPRQAIFYLASTSNSSTNPKSVVALSTTGAVVWATPLPFEPGHIAVSDDGSTLYVNAWAPETQVARLNLSTHAIELMFSLPTSPATGGQFQPQDVAVIPGSPHAAVVSMIENTTFGSALAVFDDASMRPTQQSNLGQARVIVRPGGSGTLYGLAAGGPFMAFTVDAQGIGPAMVGTPPGSLGPYARDFSYDGEYIISNNGIFLDPRTGIHLGTYAGDPAAVAVDRPGHRSYLALPPPMGEATGPLVVVECSRMSFIWIRTLTLNQVGAAYRMVRAMDDTLALDALIVTSNALLLIQPSAWSSATP
jgi:hypothetical protein